MAKVQVTETAAQQIIKQAQDEHQVTDATGRVITLRKAPVLAQFNIVKAVGSEAAQNAAYMAMVMPLLYVKSIRDGDGDALISSPTNQLQLEALIGKLGEDGVLAVMEGVQKHYAQIDPEKAKGDLKNA